MPTLEQIISVLSRQEVPSKPRPLRLQEMSGVSEIKNTNQTAEISMIYLKLFMVTAIPLGLMIGLLSKIPKCKL